MRQFRLLFGFLCAVAAAVLVGACTDSRAPAGETATTEPARRPNILFILADDMGYSDLGVFGGEIPTPNLEPLARGGMLLTDFYAGMTCGPTRAGRGSPTGRSCRSTARQASRKPSSTPGGAPASTPRRGRKRPGFGARFERPPVTLLDAIRNLHREH